MAKPQRNIKIEVQDVSKSNNSGDLERQDTFDKSESNYLI